MATLCTDALPPSKYPKQRDWLSLLRPASVSMAPRSSLRFSLSLNDVGQRMDSLCRGLHFIDRTCSEGELDVDPEPDRRSGLEQKAHELNSKLVAAPTTCHSSNSNAPPSKRTHLIPSLTNDYKYMMSIPSSKCLSSNPTVTASFVPSTRLPLPPAPGPGFLRLALPFSRSSTSASLQGSEMSSYASHLHKSSSTLLEGAESRFPSGDPLGDDDVFEEDHTGSLLKGKEQPPTQGADDSGCLRAPLCYMDEDSDLESCSSPLSEKPTPLSPFSVSGDCCRWVTVWMV